LGEKKKERTFQEVCGNKVKIGKERRNGLGFNFGGKFLQQDQKRVLKHRMKSFILSQIVLVNLKCAVWCCSHLICTSWFLSNME